MHHAERGKIPPAICQETAEIPKGGLLQAET